MDGSSPQQGNESIKTLHSDGFDFISSITDVAHRPYWSRFWIIQEFLLCRNVNLHCGSDMIDWLLFQELLERHANADTTGMNPHHAAENCMARSLPAFPLLTSRHPDQFPETPQPLYDLLVNHSNAQCKDPRDRVFALLGLIPQDEREMLDRFFPDYTLSHENVVVIALAHVMDINLKELTADSERVFACLGVKSRARRKMLLRRSMYFGYLESEGDTSYLRELEAEDKWRDVEAGGVDESMIDGDHADDSDRVDESDALGDGVCRRPGKKMLLGCLLLGVVIWIHVKQ
jgi:hypothetical protein